MSEFRVGIYLRLSREDKLEGESGSISSQRKIIMDYIREHELLFIDEYVDDGVSGTTFVRDGFLRMIDDIRKKRINMVITKDTSRLGRDHIEFGYYVEKFFPEHQVRYVAIGDNIDTFSSYNDMILFKSAYNDMYVRDISNKIRQSLVAKKKSGEFVGAYAPYGYVKDVCNPHNLVIDEVAASVVREIFSLFFSGKSVSFICNYLTERGVMIPSVYKRMNRGIRSSIYGVWRERTVTDILKNPTYMGNLTQGKCRRVSYKSKKRVRVREEDWIIKEGGCPAIVDGDLFMAVQEQFRIRRYQSKVYSSDEILLKGMVFCSECGHVIGFRKSSNGTIYGNCNYYLKYRKVGACVNHSVRYDVLEKVVRLEMERIIGMISPLMIVDKIRREKRELLKRFSEDEKIDIYLKEIEDLKQKINFLYDDRLDKIIDKDTYLKKREELEEKIFIRKRKMEEIKGMRPKELNLEEFVLECHSKILCDRDFWASCFSSILLTDKRDVIFNFRFCETLDCISCDSVVE